MGRFPFVLVAATSGVVAFLSTPMQAAAQKTSSNATSADQAPGGYVFRSNVRRVPLDVIVLDKNGAPVRGLTKDDFVVEEDRNPQNVLSFEFFDGTAPTFVPPK